MSLLEKFNKDMITAMKEQDKERLTVLRMVKGAMQLEHINNKKEVNEELLIDCVGKQIKMRNDSINEFERAGRQDLADKTKSEVVILNDYLPVQLSEEEVNAIIDEAFNKINPTSAKEMGLIMKEVTPQLKGKADMKKVSEIIKGKLG
ncbi:MAG: GatB/YqeY domain-containing protein [Bacilli bacterium]|nr:GatB/YqeY domain-containing protein [Bacilli bacterium]